MRDLRSMRKPETIKYESMIVALLIHIRGNVSSSAYGLVTIS